MRPVWIKYWGLIPMTRRGYLIAQVVAGLIAVVVFLVWAYLGQLPPLRTLWQEVPVRTPEAWLYWLFNNLYRLIAIALLAHILDTVLVLRRFSRKEAELHRQSAAPPLTQEPSTPIEAKASSTEGGS